ncbi:MAG: hypothetical protein ABSF34_02950 [Verrucomicrobiota bacterium]|jgi:hypothetical protein
MKKIIFAVLWMFASFIIGLFIFGQIITTTLWIPAHADLSSPDVQRKAMDIGLVIWIFLIGLPLIALILGICGVLPGTRRGKNLVKT